MQYQLTTNPIDAVSTTLSILTVLFSKMMGYGHSKLVC